MFFDKKEDFTKKVTESFGRFGIKIENSDVAISKGAVRFDMFDSLHDSSYVAIARETPAGKKASKSWQEIINTDLIPAVKSYAGKGDLPAAALIIPAADIESVDAIFKSRQLTPAVYQLFSGYLVAGFKKSDVAKLAAENETKKDEPAKPNEHLKDIEPEKPVQTPPKSKSATMPMHKKLAAAALLGVAFGALPFAAKAVMDNITDRNINEESQSSKDAAEKYFQNIIDGSSEDMELMKSIAQNPQLSAEYLRKLADTPVGVDVLKNPSAPDDIIKSGAASSDEERRAAVAGNEKTPIATLARLLTDRSVKVRMALAKNPAITQDMMAYLSRDLPEVRESLLENNQLPPDILDAITNGLSQNCESKRKMMANPCMSAEALLYNAQNPDECIRAGVAGNPNSSPDTIYTLSNDNSPKVRDFALRNSTLAPLRVAELFPPNWSPKPDDEALETDRISALQNAAVNSDILKKALFLDPKRYAAAVAKNKSAPAEIAGKIRRISEGSSGLKGFIDNALDIKDDKNLQRFLTQQAAVKGEPFDKTLRRKLNNDFTEAVYDPYRVIDDFRNAAIPGNKNIAKGMPSSSKQSEPLSVPYDFERFSELPSPELENGDNILPNDVERAVFAAADAIIDTLMADIMPAVAADGKGGGLGNSPAGNGGGGNGQSDGSLSLGGEGVLGSGGTGYSGAGGGSIGSSSSPDWIFQNACEEINSLRGLF